MEMFWAQLIKPFLALFVLAFIAWPIKRLVELKMREGWLKRALLKRRGDAMQAWFERADQRMFDAAKAVGRWVIGRPGRR